MTDTPSADRAVGRGRVRGVGRGRVRGRYDVLIPLEGAAYVRVTSRKDRSLSRAEILAGLRRLCDEFAERPAHERPAYPVWEVWQGATLVCSRAMNLTEQQARDKVEHERRNHYNMEARPAPPDV